MFFVFKNSFVLIYSYSDLLLKVITIIVKTKISSITIEFIRTIINGLTRAARIDFIGGYVLN